MTKLRRTKSKSLLASAVAGLSTIVGDKHAVYAHPTDVPKFSLRREAAPRYFTFQHDNVLGTSLDLFVQSLRPGNALVCEQQVLVEIERLRRIFSTYDPSSEISRVRTGSAAKSTELAELFSAYDLWSARTGGAIHINMASVIRLWKEAARDGRLPDQQTLREAFNAPFAFNVDALGKSFIVDRAVEVARQFAPAGLLDIGGDIRAWGDVAWPVGIADPQNPAENAPPLLSFTLRDAAVATSGGYARSFTIASQRFSHVIDPRTLRPSSLVSSATIVAADCLTANALSTAASVLGLSDGAKLARMFGAQEHLIVAQNGRIESTVALAVGESAPPAPQVADKPTDTPTPAAETGAAWPTNHQVTINLAFKTPPSNTRAYRPYVVIWVENANKQLVRTVAVLGTDFRWMGRLTTWWGMTGSYSDSYTVSISRATRAPGQYAFVWDGLDDKGRRVPQGEYKIFVETNREHGRHLTESAAITCGKEALSVELRENAELNVSRIEYGPKSK